MEKWEKYKTSLNELFKNEQPLTTEKRIKAAAIIHTFLAKEFNIEAILVGGLATEVYTEGGYRTRDIDMVSSGQAAYQALVQLGFSVHKGGMVAQLTYRHSGLFVEFPSSQLEDADRNRVADVKVSEDFYFKIIGVEDLLIDRIRGILYHGRTENQLAVIRMINKQLNQLDWDYLLKQFQTPSELETFNYLYLTSSSPVQPLLVARVEASRKERGITIPALSILSKAQSKKIFDFLWQRRETEEEWYALYVGYDTQLELTEEKEKGTFAHLDDLSLLFMDYEEHLISKEQVLEELYGFLMRKFFSYLSITIN